MFTDQQSQQWKTNTNLHHIPDEVEQEFPAGAVCDTGDMNPGEDHSLHGKRYLGNTVRARVGQDCP